MDIKITNIQRYSYSDFLKITAGCYNLMIKLHPNRMFMNTLRSYNKTELKNWVKEVTHQHGMRRVYKEVSLLLPTFLNDFERDSRFKKKFPKELEEELKV